MIRIEEQPWNAMVGHAREAYPHECCGVMLGRVDGAGLKVVQEAFALENALDKHQQRRRYEVRPEDLLAAEREARERRLQVIGIYHSHPDCAAYFSDTDLKNSCPWYSFVVLSIRAGAFDHARSWLPNEDQTRAEQEELVY